MSAHWKVAFRYAARVSAGAALAGVGIWLFYGATYAGAFVYGVAMGLLSFVSMAATVSLLTGRSTAGMMMIGALSFGVRCGFVIAALWIPAYLSLWPVVAMLCGFAVVYLAENIVLLPMIPRKVSSLDGKSGGSGAERKVST